MLNGPTGGGGGGDQKAAGLTLAFANGAGGRGLGALGGRLALHRPAPLPPRDRARPSSSRAGSARGSELEPRLRCWRVDTESIAEAKLREHHCSVACWGDWMFWRRSEPSSTSTNKNPYQKGGPTLFDYFLTSGVKHSTLLGIPVIHKPGRKIHTSRVSWRDAHASKSLI